MAISQRPNFLIIVADDLGFSDVGCFGGEIKTPNIDKLAQEGIRHTGFHAAAACSPTRAMIMTGTDHHIAGLGNLIEWTTTTGQNAVSETEFTTAPQRGMPGYEGYLNDRVVTLPEILRDNGYHTMMSGKWHLGLTPERFPYARGFERSFSLLPACSNHYGWRPDAEKNGEVPEFLEKSTIALHVEDDRYVDQLPDDWYSSDGYGGKMIKFLNEWQQINASSKDKKPFFAYLPFSAPHWPLQAPKGNIDHYKDAYKDGPEALRQRRLANVVKLGMIPADIKPHPVVVDEETIPWEDMTPQEQALSSKAMEAFSGMVEKIDENVGRVVAHLSELGELDNTLVMFMSDNGPEGAEYELYPMVKGPLMEHLGKYYNNEISNIGEKDSFVWYGTRWAQASSAPSRLYKAFTTEGGVRVPCVTRWPAASRKAEISHVFASVMDIAPTILDMAGIQHPAPHYKGREVTHMRGKSMLPFLQGKAESVHPPDFVYGWELSGKAAIRKAQYKAVFIPKPKGPEKWQLYDLSKDLGETDDLAEGMPEKLDELLKLWEDYVKECGVVPLQPELGAYLAATEAQMPENAWMEYDYWKPTALVDREKFMQKRPKFTRPLEAKA
ncbi:hypothetical protein MMC25_001493 [Agyrium rufum]|nr:hypothetical protein [Agyrium rufum]